MKKSTLLGLVLVCGLASAANAQPGPRTALVYGARVVGDPQWHFSSLSVQSTLSAPVTVEVGVFSFRSQGVGLSTCVFKAYVDSVGTNAVQIVEDLTNGTPVSGIDGRVGEFNVGPAYYQSVFTNRGAAVPGSGFRISSPNDGPDSGTPGGISVHQESPIDEGGDPNPSYVTADGVLTYRFNVVASPVAFPSMQSIHIFTPLSRVVAYYVHNSLTEVGVTDLKSSLQLDPVDLNINWVPAPGTMAVLSLAALLPRRRRPSGVR